MTSAPPPKRRRRTDYHTVAIYQDAFDKLRILRDETFMGLPSKSLIIEWLIDRIDISDPVAIQSEWSQWLRRRHERRRTWMHRASPPRQGDDKPSATELRSFPQY